MVLISDGSDPSPQEFPGQDHNHKKGGEKGEKEGKWETGNIECASHLILITLSYVKRLILTHPVSDLLRSI